MSKVVHNINPGDRFGMLTVLGLESNEYVGNATRAIYRCRCDCGNTTHVYKANLISGSTRSCGCPRGRAQVLFEYEGGVYSMAELSEMSGIPREVLNNRRCRGWSIEKAMTTPVQPQSRTIRIEYKGKEYTYKDISDRTGVSPVTVRKRLHYGWSIEKVMNTGFNGVPLPKEEWI